MPSGRVLTSEDFINQIKVKEEKIEKEMRQKEERKRKKDQQVSQKNDRNIKKAKVNEYTLKYQHKPKVIIA